MYNVYPGEFNLATKKRACSLLGHLLAQKRSFGGLVRRCSGPVVSAPASRSPVSGSNPGPEPTRPQCGLRGGRSHCTVLLGGDFTPLPFNPSLHNEKSS